MFHSSEDMFFFFFMWLISISLLRGRGRHEDTPNDWPLLWSM